MRMQKGSLILQHGSWHWQLTAEQIETVIDKEEMAERTAEEPKPKSRNGTLAVKATAVRRPDECNGDLSPATASWCFKIAASRPLEGS